MRFKCVVLKQLILLLFVMIVIHWPELVVSTCGLQFGHQADHRNFGLKCLHMHMLPVQLVWCYCVWKCSNACCVVQYRWFASCVSTTATRWASTWVVGKRCSWCMRKLVLASTKCKICGPVEATLTQLSIVVVTVQSQYGLLPFRNKSADPWRGKVTGVRLPPTVDGSELVCTVAC